MLGKPMPLKKPGFAVVKQATDFFLAFGKDNKKMESLLNEMKEVQKNNESIFSTISSEQSRIEKAWEDIKESKKHLTEDWEAFHISQESCNTQLQHDRDQFNNLLEARAEEHRDAMRKAEELYNSNVQSHEGLSQRELDFEVASKRLKEKKVELDSYRDSLNDRFGKLTAIINQLKGL